MIAGQIDRLAATDRTILRYASVLGDELRPRPSRGRRPRGRRHRRRGVGRLGVLVREPTGNLRFRNTLIRDAAYEGLPYRRRRDLHARVGETIEATRRRFLDEEVGTLALHYFEAQRWDKAWTFCRMAGDRAMRIYANVEAASFFSQGPRGRTESPRRPTLASSRSCTSDEAMPCTCSAITTRPIGH